MCALILHDNPTFACHKSFQVSPLWLAIMTTIWHLCLFILQISLLLNTFIGTSCTIMTLGKTISIFRWLLNKYSIDNQNLNQMTGTQKLTFGFWCVNIYTIWHNENGSISTVRVTQALIIYLGKQFLIYMMYRVFINIGSKVEANIFFLCYLRVELSL